MMRNKFKVLVVHDRALVRYCLRRLLRADTDIEQVGEAGNTAEALTAIRTQAWDVVVLAIDLQEGSALDALRRIKKDKPALPVLILTVLPEENFGIRALKAGASGFLSESTVTDELIVAVRRVVDGGAYVSPALALQLASRFQGQVNEPVHEHLSDREIIVLCAIARGKKLVQIAHELHLSAKTITTYRRRLLGKLGIRSNPELVRYAVEHRLIV
jgi:DNA-binding NarL/FixJ family response regulator